TAERVRALSALEWASDDIFVEIPATGYYFPLIYAPQALGLAIGEMAGLSVQQSYYLARYLAFSFSLLLIAAAFLLCPPNPLAVAILILPMSLFQLISTSMDGVAAALAVICISLFIKS